MVTVMSATVHLFGISLPGCSQNVTVTMNRIMVTTFLNLVTVLIVLAIVNNTNDDLFSMILITPVFQIIFEIPVLRIPLRY
jgi:hypothetical protein